MNESTRALKADQREHALRYIDSLVDTYVNDTSNPMAGWEMAEPNNSLSDPDRLKIVLRSYALRLLEQGKNPEHVLHKGSLSELAKIANIFTFEFTLLEEVNSSRNCVMYGLEQVHVACDLKPSADLASILSVLHDKFRLIPDATSDDFEDGDLLVLYPDDEEEVHVAVLEVKDGKITCRSKLGSLWVVRNSDIQDLFKYYHSKRIEIYRKK